MNKYISLESTIRSLGAKNASSPMEKDMNDQVHAGSYSSKHFEVSKPAQKLFASLPKDVDTDKAEKSLQLHDKLFAIHKKTKAAERSTKQDVDAAQELHDQIMSLSKEMGIEDKVGHVKDSLDFIKKNVDTESNTKDDINPDDAAKRFATPPKDYQSDVKSDADIDNISKFKISRDKRAQRKLKIIDDQYIPGVTEMDRIENLSPSFLEALKQVQENAKELAEKKEMSKADIAALAEPKGTFDEKDLAALRAGKHKKKVAEEKEESAAHEKAEKKHNNTPAGVECPVCGMKACPTVKEEAEQINEDELYKAFMQTVHSHAKTMTPKKFGKEYPSMAKHQQTIAKTPRKDVHRLKVDKDGKAFMHVGVEEEVENVEEGVRSIARSARTWADKKTSSDIAKKHSLKAYTPPGTPSKAEMRKTGEDAVRRFLAKGRKITKEEVEDEVETLDELSIYKMQAISKAASKRGSDMSDKKGNKHQVYGAETADELIKKRTGTYNPSTTTKVTDWAKGKLKARSMKSEEVETLDEAQFVVIQKGMEKKRIRNNPAEIMQARKDGWAINEDTETVDEANELKNLGKAQASAVVKREVQQKKAMFAKKDSVDKAKFSKQMQNIKAGDEMKMEGEELSESMVAAKAAAKEAHAKGMNAEDADRHIFNAVVAAHKGKSEGASGMATRARINSATDAGVAHFKKLQGMKEEFMERAIAILGEEYASLSFEELVLEAEKKARGRPRKNPLPDPNAPKRPRGRPKKGSSSPILAAGAPQKPADTDKDREHIVMGLRKAVSLRGEHGVKFADGSTHKIPAEHAQKALKIHDSLSKPSEKMTFARKLAASHDSFKKALQDKNPGSEETKKSGITLAKRAD